MLTGHVGGIRRLIRGLLLGAILVGAGASLGYQSGPRRTRQMLAGILESAPAGIGVVENGILVQVNDYILELSGYTREELIGQNAQMLYPASDAFFEVEQVVLAQIDEKGTGSVETRWQKKDGGLRYVLLSATLLDPGDLSVGIVFTVVDISERHQAQERFVKAFESNPAPLVLSIIDTGEFIDVNDSWIHMLGYTREEQIGYTSKDLGIWSDPGQRDRAIAKLKRDGYFREEPIHFRTKDGRDRFARWSGEIIMLDDREVLLSLLVDETERYQAEERFLKAFASNPGALVITEADDGRIIDVNQRAVEVFGYSREEMIGKTTLALGIWSSEQMRDEYVHEFVTNGSVRDKPVQLWAKGGREVLVRWSSEPITLNGKSALLSFVRDETDYKRTAMALTTRTRWFMIGLGAFVLVLLTLLVRLGISLRRQKAAEMEKLEAERNYRDIFDASSNAIFVHDMDTGDILDVNARMLSMYEYPDKQTACRCRIVDLSDASSGYDESKIAPIIESARKIGTCSFEWQAKKRGGNVFSVQATITKIVVRGVERLLCEIRDITDQKKAEEAQRASEENLRVTFASIGDAVIATDTAGNVQRMNLVAEKLTGWSFEHAVGRPLRDIFRIVNADSKEEVTNPVDRVMTTGEIVGLANHTVLLSRDGTEYHISDSGAPIRDDDNTILGVVLVFRDISVEYEMEERLRQSQKMDAIGHLAGGIAHDFNNMLGGILGGVEMLRMQPSLASDALKFLDMIETSAQRAGDLTRKLLSFARRQPVQNKAIDMHAVIESVMDILSSTIDRRIRIDVALAADNFFVLGDASMLQSVFLNLGINASHAMPGGGRLTIESRIVEFGEIDSQTVATDLSAGRYLEIAIRDTGSGIAPENLHRIFEPFFTTKPQGEGTGLGLAASLGTIQQHGGTISVHSEVGVGTTFRIFVPLTSKTGALEPTFPETIVPGSGCILLVDDEEVIRIGGAAILEDAGYQVLTAEDGAVAVDIYRTRHEEIDVIILDMIMPNMNGRDCFHAMRAIRPDARIILSSGFSREEDLRDMKVHGLAGFIDKPFRGASLTRMVASILGNTDS